MRNDWWRVISFSLVAVLYGEYGVLGCVDGFFCDSQVFDGGINSFVGECFAGEFQGTHGVGRVVPQEEMEDQLGEGLAHPVGAVPFPEEIAEHAVHCLA